MRRCHLILSLCVLLLLTPRSWALLPASASFMSRPAIIPFEIIRSGHIAIYARINGHGPYRFIFDTGAPMLLISEQVAKDARILPRDFQRPFFTPMGNLGEFNVKSITLGRSVQANVQADIWNHPTVEELSRAFGRFEGLIGYPFFSRYQVTIDYQARTMTLIPSTYQPTDTQEKMTRRLTQAAAGKFFSPNELIGIQISKPDKDQTAGVVIADVMPKSPADDAGIHSGDRLLTLDGRWTDSIEDCYAALSSIVASRSVSATVLRDGKQMNIALLVKPAI